MAVLHRYLPDFAVYRDRRKKRLRFILESKGKFTPKDRKKMVAVKAAYPEVEFKLLFMRDNRLVPKSKTNLKRYSDWATENGFDYAIGHELPDRWFT